MPRPLLLYSGAFADLPFEELAARAVDWGYQGLELACSTEHLEVQRAVSEPTYCAQRLEQASRQDLQIPVLNCQRMCLLLGDHLDDRYRELAPDYVWGDGRPDGIRHRVVEELLATVQAAQKMGVGLVVGAGGSPFGSALIGCLPIPTEAVARAFRDFAQRIMPVLDACRDAGTRFGYVIQPGQLAFDLYSAELLLESVSGREELGFVLDPASLHWQGVDPIEFIQRFPDRIVHVHVNDAVLNLNGRSGILNSYLPPGDPRRGWDYRSPGHGGVDWPGIIRALNYAGYDGALSVHWRDAGMHRDYGAEDAARFVKQLDWDRAVNSGSPMFQ
ncbi:MAG: sugar phosphate isomerase/epimerase [Gemmataceae bacterium]|nr:sugar phosphate isomerase/epimerase [Gemmataceae bacterium]